ncbi:MAG: hypothetical protein V3R56_08570, partial [Xanthomonadales bacterium]
MNIKRAFLILAAALLLPGLAMAQTTAVATLEIDFDFSDGNTDLTSVLRVSCDAGLPLNSDSPVGHNSTRTFVVQYPEEGVSSTDCVVTADDVPNYTTSYACGNDDG